MRKRAALVLAFIMMVTMCGGNAMAVEDSIAAGASSAIENENLIYQGEIYYPKQKDNPAADLQPGEQILIPVSDNSGFSNGYYKLTIRSCGNRDALYIKVNGIKVGGISRKATEYKMETMHDDTLVTPLELKSGDVLAIEAPTGTKYGWIDYIVLEPVSDPEENQEPITWEAEDYYSKKVQNSAADLQSGEKIDIKLGSNKNFEAGLYYIMVSSCGDRTILYVEQNGTMLGSITRNKSKLSTSGMTPDTLLRPIDLSEKDIISILAPKDSNKENAAHGWIDKITLVPVNAAFPQDKPEYQYPGQAYKKTGGDLSSAVLNPGESMEIPLRDNRSFKAGSYRVMITSNGTREKFSIQLNHKDTGTISRQPSNLGVNEMTTDAMNGILQLNPSDIITITAPKGNSSGCVNALILEPAEDVSDLSESKSYVKNLVTDKSMYTPGDTVKATLSLEKPNGRQWTAKAVMMLKHLDKTVWQDTAQISSSNGSFSFKMQTPESDFTGYSLEVYIYQDTKLVDYEMTGVDVSSDWNVFPRYGYITQINQSKENVEKTLDRLKDHHINGLFYYDVYDTQEKPLAGTVAKPADTWKTLNQTTAQRQTLLDTINIGHDMNMKSFFYNLIFGAYDDYEAAGVSPEWGMYKDKSHQNQDAHDLSGIGWETEKLWLMNPANTQWQDYYIKAHNDLFKAYPYDGIQVDSLGPRGDCYDFEGNPIQLDKAYVPLLNRLAEESDKKVIFNPVSGYGLESQLESVNYDIVYMEVWPGDAPDFASLKEKVDEIYKSTEGKKGTVLGAYMNYGASKSEQFNVPSINYINNVLMATGASHLELGDTGMLSSEYYPGKSMRISDALESDLKDNYSFMVAYENLLRGTGLSEVKDETYIGEKRTGSDFKPGNVTSFTKIKQQAGEADREILHLLNFDGASHDSWVDQALTQTAPTVKQDLQIRHATSKAPTKVWAASPDDQKGILTPLEFSYENGYVTFTLPSLEYYTMVVME